MRLTKINISKVSLPQGKNEIIQFDDTVPGFGFRVRLGGSVTWIFQYSAGQQTTPAFIRRSVGNHRTQRPRDASELHARLRLGQDAGGEKIENRVRAVETFGSVLKPYRSHAEAFHRVPLERPGRASRQVPSRRGSWGPRQF
jgi:hypothetical protein